MQLSKGSILGSYRIEEFIASGGMGEVYKARHTQLERWVAIKVIREDIADDPGTLARFKREAKSASRLEHPNICRVYNFGQDGGRSFLVLEYLEGETLAVRIGREKLSITEILQLGAEVAEALDHAHDHGLVHRDLKPSNIMLTKSGCKILDFGVAKRSHASEDSPFPEGGGTGSSTHEGVILGTLPYVAPEQVEGGGSDARTDIHALGAILYQVLTKRLPFEGRTPAALAVDILRGTPRPIEELEPTAPAALTRAVDKCLRKDPADRWQTARDLASELRWITTLDLVSGASGRTSDLTPGARDPVWGPGGRLAYVGEGGLSIYFWDMNSAAPPRSILSSQRGKIPTDWSPDGSTLLHIERSDRTDEDYDVFALDVATETTRRVLGRPPPVITCLRARAIQVPVPESVSGRASRSRAFQPDVLSGRDLVGACAVPYEPA